MAKQDKFVALCFESTTNRVVSREEEEDGQNGALQLDVWLSWLLKTRAHPIVRSIQKTSRSMWREEWFLVVLDCSGDGVLLLSLLPERDSPGRSWWMLRATPGKERGNLLQGREGIWRNLGEVSHGRYNRILLGRMFTAKWGGPQMILLSPLRTRFIFILMCTCNIKISWLKMPATHDRVGDISWNWLVLLGPGFGEISQTVSRTLLD